MPSATLPPTVRRVHLRRRRTSSASRGGSGAAGPTSSAVLALVLLALFAVPAAAAPAGPPARFAPPGLSEAEAKVSTDLLGLADDRFLLPNQSHGDMVSALARSGQYAKAGERHGAVGTPATDLVEVYVRTDPGAGTAALRQVAHRVSGADPATGLVAAWIAPDRILDLARVPSVREIRPVLRPRVRTGSVVSAGDALLRAAALREATGLSGAGIRVGVISDGVDHRRSAQSTGDLPADLTVLRNEVGGDEGTAMLEIVHDIAPNASLVFHDCGWDVLEFNEAVDALVEAGCRVIVDDIGWTDEPFFEDGVIAAHAEDVVNGRGVVWVSAAGNDAALHYQGPFQDDGQGWHDFSAGKEPLRNRLYVDLPAGTSVTVILEWSEPFGAAAADHDLALYDTSDLSVPLAASSRVQDGDDDPLEVVTWVNPRTETVHAEVDVSGPTSGPARTLELFVYPQGGAALLPANTVAEDSVYGHPGATGVIAVAAIDATDPAGGRLEPYSSRGPVTITAPVASTRQKPDCAGVDGVRVTGAGSFPTAFWGTSASAPHAAGIAALVWSGRQDATGAQLRSALTGTADDLGDDGADTAYGAGRVNATALNALFSVVPRRAAVLPGRIEVEDYDAGGEGVAYHDLTAGNEGGAYRHDDVDIEPLPGGGGYNVGWIRPGEWLRYRVNVSTTGVYDLRVRGASSWGSQSLVLSVDGITVAVVPVAATRSYDVFALTNATVNLTSGLHDLRITLSGYANLDWIEFALRDGVLRLPGATADPVDADGDGLYEDVNGNGRRDFADVVLFFNQMAWIAASEPIVYFDYNANGRIDFADVTTLFGSL